MEDYQEGSGGRRKQVRRSIESLEGKLKKTRNPFQQSSIEEELSKLELERMQIDSLFRENEEEVEEEVAADQFPYLNVLWNRYEHLVKQCRHVERDVRASFLYMQFFEDEFLGMFTVRKLRLDVQYSVERDQFYDLFHQVQRSLLNYRTEADRIAQGTYTKEYEAEILKRKVEMRLAVLVELDWYFRKVRRFAKVLLEDIDGDGLLCQNPEEKLDYTRLDRETTLRNRTVATGLAQLLALAVEAIEYVEVPDFQQRAL
ncbi:MAG: hypothetical protein KOO61_04835 [Spirochaetales bacterium]|nr:hypothetical protein [Spirochaetales bacterium]